MNKAIWYTPLYGDYDEIVMINRITHIVKVEDSEKGDYTLICLDTGEKIHVKDSIKTLEARINSG